VSAARSPGGQPARPPSELQMTTTDGDDRRQQAKQYWPIRRASTNDRELYKILYYLQQKYKEPKLIVDDFNFGNIS